LSPWLTDDPPAPRLRVRRALATVLWRSGQALTAWASHMASTPAAAPGAQTLPRLEFHADGAAPEGALYVDGVLFGHLDGVTRL
jgi:hypothetical protein